MSVADRDIDFGGIPNLCLEHQPVQSTVDTPPPGGSPCEICNHTYAIERFPAQQVILREGDVPRRIFILKSGWAFQFRRLPNGARQILHLLVPGDIIPLEQLYHPGAKMTYSVRSLTKLELCALDARDISELLRRGFHQERLLGAILGEYLAGKNERLIGLGRRSAMGRLVQFLLELEERMRRCNLSVDGCFPFPVSQEHVADCLGLTTVYVNRLLDRLRRDKIIEFDRRTMRIVNMAVLKSLLEEG